MKKSLLLILGAICLLTSVNVSATIKNGIRQKPEIASSALKAFVVSSSYDDSYYLYNVKAKAFYANGNDYNTRSSVNSDFGLKVAFFADTEYSDTYRFYDDYQGYWRMTFIDSKTAMYVDYNNQANYRWGIEKSGNTFRIFASPNGNPGWGSGSRYTACYESGKYIGVDASENSTIVYPYLSSATNHYIDWSLVTESDYYQYYEAVYCYNKAEELRVLIEEAKGYGLSVTQEQAVYLNESATYTTIVNTINSLQERINEWKLSQADNATVANPADLTIKIVNPSFDGNDLWTGWYGTEFGAASPRENAEHFEKTYNTYQTITGLKKGIYAVGVKAFYRAGDAQTAYNNYKADNEASRYARFYGSCGFVNIQTPIVSPFTANQTQAANVGSESSVYDYELWKQYYIPNNMIAAEYYMHSLGYYDNRVLVPVDESGELTIGVRKDKTTSSDWSIFDDFTLTYYGDGDDAHQLFTSTYTLAKSFTLSASKTQLVVGETVQATTTITPSGATFKTLYWTSGNPQVASVSDQGLITALESGTTVITAYTTDGSNLSKSLTITVTKEEITPGSIVFNEIMAANVDEFVSPAFNLDGWAELYNTSSKNISLTGLYLSDEATNLKKWRIPISVGILPANGYALIWFDSNGIAQQNAPFKLDVDGGSLYLSDATGQVLASQAYPAAMQRVSYARTTDGGDIWGLAIKATPGKSNTGTTYASSQLTAPVVDQPSQLFNGQLSINVTIPSGCKLAFTTDGSLPTLQSAITYIGQFTCSATTIYRFRLFATDNSKLPSPVTTRSYIYRDNDYYLPIVSVVGEYDFLYGDEMGVLVQGSGNGRPGNGTSYACNWNMDWERPVNFSYLTADGEMVLNQDVDLEMCGGWSRAWEPHSFKLKGNKEMGGNKHLPYPFFTQKPYIRNRTLQIRNGGNDTNARFKDPALQYLVQSSDFNLDCQSYQPVHEFINGNYIGVLNIREPNNKHYVYANYGWDDDEIDQFEMSPDSGYIQKCGTPDAFNELVDVLSPDAANSETYAEICKRLDIDSYANYMALELYLGSTDWPQNNVKAFRHIDNGKFRFVLFDLDGVFGTSDPFNKFMEKENYTFDQLYPTSLGRITAHIRFVTLFKNLLKNADFRRRFIDAFCIVGGSVLEASRAESIINELQDRVQAAMNLEGKGKSLDDTANSLRNNLAGRNSTSVNAMKNYSTFNLSATTAQNVKLSSDAAGAQLLINGQRVPTGTFNGSLFAPVTLKAVAPAGYTFQGWKSTTSIESQTLLANGAQWSYYDQGSLDGQNWQSPTYSESGWSKGNAPLGYGKDYIATTLDYGSDANQKRPTAYFRTTVSLAQTPAADDEFTMNCTIDDGAIVYVNGEEAARYNISASNVTFDSYADHYAHDNPDYATLQLPASLFHKGNNVIAVELHNCDNHSTDLVWDASLSSTVSSSNQEYYSTADEIDLPKGSNITLVASYRELTSNELATEGINPVRINEVSGANNSFINEYQKKGDWIELYNTTNQEIDVEGMYLTDNLDKPEKYRLTKGTTNANTKIPAHGFLLIWCDKQNTTDQALHASFKIAAEGGVLMLTAASKAWKDTFYYGAHDANTTIGRYPDGAANIYAMNMATIATPNMLTSYMVKIDQSELETTTRDIDTPIASANGFRIRYGAQQLLVKSEDAETATVDIFTTDGRLVEQTAVTLHQGSARLSVAHLPAGFYVARATDGDGNRVGCKFMK